MMIVFNISLVATYVIIIHVIYSVKSLHHLTLFVLGKPYNFERLFL